MGNPRIIVDTREQKPLWTKSVIRKGLSTGDYTIEGLEDEFVIERKSPGDLYGSIIQGHARFRRELLRAREEGKELVVVVECLEKDFYAKRWPGGYRLRVKGNVLAKIIHTIKERYGVEFVWCDGRVATKKVVKELLFSRLKSREIENK